MKRNVCRNPLAAAGSRLAGVRFSVVRLTAAGWIVAGLLMAGLVAQAQAQEVITYYQPSVPVAGALPLASGTTTSYYAPTTTYYAPAATYPSYPGATTAYYAPTTTYYAPSVPVTTYYAPQAATPVTAYAPVTTTSYYSPYWVRPKVYVAGQPVRNLFRAITP